MGEPDALQQILTRLAAIEQRLESIETTLQREGALRSRLDHVERARADLADQTLHLIDQLGDARAELREKSGG